MAIKRESRKEVRRRVGLVGFLRAFRSRPSIKAFFSKCLSPAVKEVQIYGGTRPSIQCVFITQHCLAFTETKFKSVS
jgi:hypothetical protein